MAKVVLIHGAWHGAWCWDGVVAALEARGIEADAVELPLTSHADDIAAARAAIEAAGPGVVVCGHSYGGCVISAATASVDDVGHLVYLCAFMLDEGEDPVTAAADFPPPVLVGSLVIDKEAGTMAVDPAGAGAAFYGDSDPADVPAIAARLRPMPFPDSWELQHPPGWRQHPSTYVVSSNDGAVPPEMQRFMATRATEVVEWDTDHSPFLTRPDAIADLLAGKVVSGDAATSA
jgi:pimeloyl-ACP methyl ester carboxylesterase